MGRNLMIDSLELPKPSHRLARIVLILSLVMGMPDLLASTSTREEAIAAIRAQFAEAIRAGKVYEASPEKDRKGALTWYSALRPAMKQPTDLVLEAIDRSLHGRDVDERSGALNAYFELVNGRRAPKNPAYFQLFLRLVSEDDRRSPFYTNSLVSALMLYPSRETVAFLMDCAARAQSAGERQNYFFLAADLLGIDVGIFQQAKPLEREQLLASFQAWYEQNKNRIGFDSEGRPSVRGMRPNAKPRALTTEERARIRKDPACILELLQGSTAGVDLPDERIQDLMGRCGDALFGREGLRLFKQLADTTNEKGAPTFDQQMSLAAARAKYPMLDAGLLAVAYVAADDVDPKHRDLAKRTLDDIGMPEDIHRVLRGEPKAVREKAMQLADEMLEKNGGP